MTTQLEYRSANLRPLVPPRSALARFITENNPCYLLSAACMLLGLMTLTNSLSFSPIPHQRLIALIATLNLYETVLIALAIWLIAKRNIIRDAEILLAIEALFLADGAMLSGEMFTADFVLGLFVNAMLLLLSIGKIWLIAKTLKISVPRTVIPLAILQLLVLGLPGLCKSAAEAHGGRLPPIALYLAWWTTAAIPSLLSLLARGASQLIDQPFAQQNKIAPARRILITFASLAAISIIVHLLLASWVYKIAWYPLDAAPILLGSAIAMMRGSRFAKPNPVAMRAQYGLCALAVLTSLVSPRELTMGLVFPLTPLRFALIGSAIVFARAFIRTRRTRFAVMSLLSLLIATLGSTPAVILDRLSWPWQSMAENGTKLLPQTSAGWGAVAVAGAFIFLAAGAVISVYKKPSAEPDVGEAFSVALKRTDT